MEMVKSKMGKSIFIVVRLYQGVVDDAIAYTDDKKATAELDKFVKQHVSQEDIDKYGYDETLDCSKIAGTTMIVTELLDG